MLLADHDHQRMVIFNGTTGAASDEWYAGRGVAIRPVKDAYTTVTSKEFKQVDLTGVSLTHKSGTDDWGLDYASNTTLKDFVENTAYENQRVYIQNIHLTFAERGAWTSIVTYRSWYAYSGSITGILNVRSYNDFYVKYNGQMFGYDAGTLLSNGANQMPQTWTFNVNDWSRVRESDTFSLDDWSQLLDLDVRYVDIASITADIRITYYE